jgi:NitT/TauT family transport system substrate-binding protein
VGARVFAAAGQTRQTPDIRTLDLDIAARWRTFAGSEHIPYLGVAAHLSWIAQHRELVPRLYRCYRDAARWVAANPAAAAAIISSGSPADIRAIERLIEDNKRLGMDVVPAGKLRREIEAVYRAGGSLGYLQTLPAASTIYGEDME